jgi:hypothetical protein
MAYFAVGLGSVGLALAMIKTEDLQALAQFASGIADIEVDSMNQLATAIERIAKAIDDMDTVKSIRFESNIDALRELENVRRLTATRASAGTAASVENVTSAINGATAASTGGGTTTGGGAQVVTKQPFELKLNGDKLGDFIITTVGKGALSVAIEQ